jgi:hypothetical protein
MDESHPEWAHPPSAADAIVIFSEGKKEEGIQRGEVESASTNPQPHEGPSASSIISDLFAAMNCWHLFTEAEYDAVIDAESQQSGGGREMVITRAKQKGASDV